MNDQSAEWVPALIKSGQESFAGMAEEEWEWSIPKCHSCDSPAIPAKAGIRNSKITKTSRDPYPI